MPSFTLGFGAAAFVAAYGLATLLSQNRSLSLLGVPHRFGGFLPVAVYVLFMLVIVGLCWEEPARLKGIAAAVTLAVIPLSAYILLQEAGADPYSWTMPGGRPPASPLGTLGNSNFAGGYLALSLPLAVYLALDTSPVLSRWIFLSVGLSVVALWFTGSRGAMLAAISGLSCMAYLYRDSLKPWMRKLGASALLVFFAVALAVVWHPGFNAPPRVLREAEVFRTDTLEVRQFYWTAALRIFRDHPLTGTGPDTFFANYGRYRTPEDGARMGMAVADKPHNIFLEYAAHSGVVGLGAYLALAVLALRYAARAARRPDDPLRGLSVAFASSFVAYLTQGLFSIDVPPLAFMGWVCLAGIAVTCDPRILAARSRGAGRNGSERAESARLLQVGAGVACIGLVILGSRTLAADFRAKSAETLATRPFWEPGGGLSAAIGEIEAATRLHPFASPYWKQAARLHLLKGARSPEPVEKAASYAASEKHLLRAHRLEPANIFIGLDLARLNTRWAQELNPDRFQLAARWWERTVRMDPHNWELKYAHARFLRMWGSRENRPDVLRRALEEMSEVSAVRPRDARVWKSFGTLSLALGESQKAREALQHARRLAPRDPEISGMLARLGG